MDTVFVVQHVHVLSSGEQDVKFIGVYRSVDSALSAVTRLQGQPGFKDHPRVVDLEIDDDPQGFHIDRYPLDKDHWSEGYVTT
jgi:hypothetical protein